MDALFDGISAWNQMIFIIIGLFMVGLGALILADFAHWRLRAQRFTGVITGVRMEGSKAKKKNSNSNFFPVIEYKDVDGSLVKGNTLSGSSILMNKIPGREVSILVMPNDPGTVKIKGYFGLIFGILFLLPGLAFWGVALHSYEVTIYTYVFGLAFLLWGGYKLLKTMKPREEWDTISEFQERKRKERNEKRAKMTLLGKTDILERLKHRDKTTLKWMPLYAVIALALGGGGAYLGKEQYALGTVGLRTQGEVIRVESEYNASSEGSGYTYYPVVAFQNEQGRKVTFRSKTGSNPPSYQTGNIVTVLYDPDNEKRAIIDHGIWNWSLPGGLMLGAVFIFIISIKSYTGARRRQSRFHRE